MAGFTNSCPTTGPVPAPREAAVNRRDLHKWRRADLNVGARAFTIGAVASVTLSVALSSVLPAQAANPPGPALVGATAAVVYDPTTGQQLYALRPNAQLMPASTTKLMTALLVTTRGPALTTEVTILPSDVATGGSSAPLVAGERISVKNLLYGLLLVSGNDAAVALARITAGSVPQFVRMMNREARTLGALRTHFVNPDGLPDPRHLTTAHDLSRIAAAAIAVPFVRRVLETKVYAFPAPTGQGTVPMVNQNRLLWTYPGFVGGKIGYTIQAGETMAAEAHRHGMSLVAVVLHDSYYGLWPDPASLLNWGFTHFRRVKFASAGAAVSSRPVSGDQHLRVPVVAGRPLAWDQRIGAAPAKVVLQLPLHVAAGQPAHRAIGKGFVVTAFGRTVAEVPLLLGRATHRPVDPQHRLRWSILFLCAAVFFVWLMRPHPRTMRRKRRYRMRGRRTVRTVRR